MKTLDPTFVLSAFLVAVVTVLTFSAAIPIRAATYGRVRSSVMDYCFSVGPDDPILLVTLENFKHAFPANHRFHDLLDANFGVGQSLGEHDELHKMLKINRSLIALREQQPRHVVCGYGSK